MSDYHKVQANNEAINGVLNHCRNVTTYLDQVNKAAGDRFPESRLGIETLNGLSQILEGAYLSSGYRYDDDDPRNRLDQGGDDGYFDREDARNGSTRLEETKAAIERDHATAAINAEIDDLKSVFTDGVASDIWSEESFPFEGHEGVRGLGSFLNDLNDRAMEEVSEGYDDLDGPSHKCLPSPQMRAGLVL